MAPAVPFHGWPPRTARQGWPAAQRRGWTRVAATRPPRSRAADGCRPGRQASRRAKSATATGAILAARQGRGRTRHAKLRAPGRRVGCIVGDLRDPARPAPDNPAGRLPRDGRRQRCGKVRLATDDGHALHGGHCIGGLALPALSQGKVGGDSARLGRADGTERHGPRRPSAVGKVRKRYRYRRIESDSWLQRRRTHDSRPRREAGRWRRVRAPSNRQRPASGRLPARRPLRRLSLLPSLRQRPPPRRPPARWAQAWSPSAAGGTTAARDPLSLRQVGQRVPRQPPPRQAACRSRRPRLGPIGRSATPSAGGCRRPRAAP